jgi:hypothetical protein
MIFGEGVRIQLAGNPPTAQAPSMIQIMFLE